VAGKENDGISQPASAICFCRSLQARVDLFKIFNHPNFGPPVNYMTSPLFGQATQMLGASLGAGGQNGGLNPLYQIGGPRSAQLALKLMF
jgi:hypothetical protein